MYSNTHSSVLLIAASLTSQALSQTTISNPQTRILGCDALQCNTKGLCSTEGNIFGVGIAPQILPYPSSLSSNLSLSLIDDPLSSGILAFRGYDFWTHAQRLLVGVPSDLNVHSQPPACALLFQNQGQTFPFLTDDDHPNSTLCGDSLTYGDSLAALTSFIRDFDANGSDSNTSVNNQISLQVPRCSQLASYLTYRLRERQALLGAYYTGVITITGGAILGPDANTTRYTPSILTDDCRPVLPSSYQLYDVLSARQVLHPSAATDTGFGGRNGTTPVLTVVYGFDGIPNVDLFCMRQYAPGNRALPQQALKFTSGSARAMPTWGWLMPLILAGVIAMHL